MSNSVIDSPQTLTKSGQTPITEILKSVID